MVVMGHRGHSFMVVCCYCCGGLCDMTPASSMGLSCMNSDDGMCHHCLDDVACHCDRGLAW